MALEAETQWEESMSHMRRIGFLTSNLLLHKKSRRTAKSNMSLLKNQFAKRVFSIWASRPGTTNILQNNSILYLTKDIVNLNSQEA